MARGGRRYYTVGSLRRALATYEAQFGIESENFVRRYLELGHVPGIDGFSAHVWLSFYEDVQRMQSAPPSDESCVPELIVAA